jgi:hypothetical protein
MQVKKEEAISRKWNIKGHGASPNFQNSWLFYNERAQYLNPICLCKPHMLLIWKRRGTVFKKLSSSTECLYWKHRSLISNFNVWRGASPWVIKDERKASTTNNESSFLYTLSLFYLDALDWWPYEMEMMRLAFKWAVGKYISYLILEDMMSKGSAVSFFKNTKPSLLIK